MSDFLAIYGSPRRRGNSSLLLDRAVAGVEEAGGEVGRIYLKSLKISPCLEIYRCRESGRCVIEDDFQSLCDRLLACKGLLLASPIFFYSVSAQTKLMMDRCQSLWVKKYWIEKAEFGRWEVKRRGLFISVGATHGKKLFDGALLTVKSFFDCLDMDLWRALLYRGLDHQGDVLERQEDLEEAEMAGREFVEAIRGL